MDSVQLPESFVASGQSLTLIRIIDGVDYDFANLSINLPEILIPHTKNFRVFKYLNNET